MNNVLAPVTLERIIEILKNSGYHFEFNGEEIRLGWYGYDTTISLQGEDDTLLFITQSISYICTEEAKESFLELCNSWIKENHFPKPYIEKEGEMLKLRADCCWYMEKVTTEQLEVFMDVAFGTMDSFCKRVMDMVGHPEDL